MKFPERHQKWLDQFIEWAKPHNDIRAAIIVGSQARKGGSLADDWSDLDIAIFTSKPRLYTRSNSWMQEISPMWAGLVDTGEVWNGVAAASGFSVYEGGLIVDTVILPTLRAQVAILFISSVLKWNPSLWRYIDNPIIRFCVEITGFFRRGTIVLFDKDGLTHRLEAITESIPQYGTPPPSAEQFQRNADTFWVDPPRAATSLRRGKLLWSLRPFNPMLRQLYKMIEWHARAKSGWDNKQQYLQKSMEKWADPFVLDALSQIHPQYDSEDIWKKLLTLMNLYRRLTVETAALLGYEYDVTTAEHILAWVEKCYQETMDKNTTRSLKSIPRVEPIVVQAVEKLFPNDIVRKNAFNCILEFIRDRKSTADTKTILALLKYSKGDLELFRKSAWQSHPHFWMDEIGHIFQTMEDAEKWVKSLSGSQN